MIYERPDQAEHKCESNLTWFRGREAVPVLNMRENNLLFRKPSDSTAYISIIFKE